MPTNSKITIRALMSLFLTATKKSHNEIARAYAREHAPELADEDLYHTFNESKRRHEVCSSVQVRSSLSAMMNAFPTRRSRSACSSS